MSEQAFLEAIIETPDDDAPRLVYADWLEDHGNAPRAEFIRVQCAREKMPHYDPRWSQLRTRERDLLAEYQREWLAPLKHLEDRKVKQDDRWEFERGFVQRATMSAQTFLRHGSELVRSTPLNWLRLSTRGVLTKVLAHPPLAQVPQLSLAAIDLSDADFRRLAESPVLGNLTGLYLGSTPFDYDAAVALAESPYTTRLATLNLCFTPIWDGLGRLAYSPHLTSLESLWLVGAGLTSNGLQAVASSPSLGKLTNLALGSGSLTAAVARSLASGGRQARLTHLDLELGSIRSAGLEAIADSPSMSKLTVLNAVDNGIGTAGVLALAGSKHLRQLRELDLSANRIGTAGAAALACSRVLASVKHLDLGYCGIGPEGIVALANSPHVKNLESLELGENKIGSEGVTALVDSPRLTSLKVLDLSHTPSIRSKDIARLRERFGDALLVSE